MWQQNPFRVDTRFLREHSELLPLSFIRADPANNNSSLLSSPPHTFDWQRIAGLVQSPASANSEGSSTSTPDQCPASPALTFCEIRPTSRNGACNVNNSSSSSMNEMQKHNVWTNIPSDQGGSLSQPSTGTSVQQPDVNCRRKWPAVSQPPPQTAIVTSGFFNDHGVAFEGWNSTINYNEMSMGGYAVDESLASRMSRDCSQQAVPPQLIGNESQNLRPTSSPSQTFSSPPVYQAADQLVKEEPQEYFLGGRNGLIIDGKVLSLLDRGNTTTSNTAAASSRIGNFMDLLRQSDKPISDATAAVSCSHLSQLLSSQEAPEMWVAHSSRFPAILSEVLPSTSGGKCSEVLDSFGNKRKLLECSTSDVDIQDRGSAVQLHEALVKQQDEDEPSHDRGAAPTNDSELFSKRPRIENSNFPFKMQVRKEKLGERISALQQLVSPFGKTDTASVLLEAIGYIKFLHEQVQVLSSPYMKHTGTSKMKHHEHGDESKQDLRSRGLCLVPISCTLQVANDNGADYWTPTLHGGLK